MSLIVLASAQGSPGVTTSALGLALSWPRPCLLVDADPTGASAIPAGYYRGGELPAHGTLIDLAMSHRQGTLAEDLPAATMRIGDSQVDFLAGAMTHSQSRSLVPLWEPLSGALKALERNGQDVMVDAGRLGLTGWPEPLVYAADLTLLVTRSTLPALVGAKSWADTLREQFERAGAALNLGVLVVGQGQPYGTREIAKVLQLPVVASVAWDQTSAEVFSLGSQPSRRRFESSPLSKSVRAAAAACQSVLSTNQANLEPVPLEREL